MDLDQRVRWTIGDLIVQNVALQAQVEVLQAKLAAVESAKSVAPEIKETT